MANKIINRKIFIVITSACLLLAFFSSKVNAQEKKQFLINTIGLNITNNDTKDLKNLKQLIKDKRPKAIYLEQWILLEPGNKKLLKKLHKIAKSSDSKLHLVVGKNSWFGDRGISNTLEYLNFYEKDIDGIVLRTEPNKINVWKDDIAITTQILNQMLDAYLEIYKEARKRNKIFVVEFPFWYNDFLGPFRSFPEDACAYSNRVSFLIDKPEKLKELKNWNNISCLYNINLTKRATTHTEEEIASIYNELKEELSFYSNFNGFIIDSDIKDPSLHLE